MFSQGRTNVHGMLWRLAFLTVLFTLQLRLQARATSQHVPSSGDFTECRLTEEEKEEFLHEHNKFRGMVNPPAADMEFLVR